MRQSALVFIFASFAFLTVVYSQDSLNIRYAGSWEPDSSFLSVRISSFDAYNGYLYVSGDFVVAESSGDTVVYHLIVLDVSDPSFPFVVRKDTMNALVYRGYLYTRRYNHLTILDGRDPFNIEEVGEFDGGDSLPRFSVICPFGGDGRTYVLLTGSMSTPVSYSMWFYCVLDVSDPSHPCLLNWRHEIKRWAGWDWNDERLGYDHEVEHRYSVAMNYPYVYVADLKVHKIWYEDPYDPHGPSYTFDEYDTTFLYRYDFRDPEAEPVVYINGKPDRGHLWVRVTAGRGVVLLIRYDSLVLILRSTEEGIDSVCRVEDLTPIHTSGDTFFLLEGHTFFALDWNERCGFDTVGYYSDDGLGEDEYVTGVKVDGEYIYASVKYFSDMAVFKQFRIYNWSPEIVQDERTREESSYLPSVIIDELTLRNSWKIPVSLCDLSGRIISKIPPGKTAIEVSNLPSGIYLLRSVNGKTKGKVLIVH